MTVTEKGFALLRSVLLGLAVAFLIVPYTNMPVYAHDEDDPRNLPGDFDSDNISNKDDVCITESYYDDSHSECLAEAGLVFRDHLTDNDIAFLTHFLPGSMSMFLLIGSANYKYGLAAIRTCEDLKSFEKNTKSASKAVRGVARLATILGFIITAAIAAISGPGLGVVAGVTAATIIQMLWSAVDILADLSDSASGAYDQLCTPQYR